MKFLNVIGHRVWNYISLSLKKNQKTEETEKAFKKQKNYTNKLH